jgi:hypothetical protein
MPRKQITRIQPLSAAKVLGLLYSGLGLVAALIFALEPKFAPDGFPREGLLLLPFINAFAGFLGGLLLAALYNLIATTIGGIIIELADDTPRDPPQH